MPIFRFVIEDGAKRLHPELVELPSIHEARSQAAIMAGQLLKDADGAFWDDSFISISVQNDMGLTLNTIMISGFDGASKR